MNFQYLNHVWSTNLQEIASYFFLISFLILLVDGLGLRAVRGRPLNCEIMDFLYLVNSRV